MSSILALIGGAEFQPGNESIDRYLIDRAGGARTARGVIIPTAAARENPNLAARNGIRWFQSLGLTMRAPLIVDQPSANDAHILASLQDANFFYLLGGDPRYLLETLRGSQAWAVIEQKYRAGEAVVAGSSAGAMILVAYLTDFRGGFIPALNLAPTPLAVLPHFSGSSPRSDLTKNLPEGVRLLGLAEKTGAVFEGRDWLVLGPGRVTVVERSGTPRAFANGERFGL